MGEGVWESRGEALFNRVVEEGLINPVTFAQRLEGSKRDTLYGCEEQCRREQSSGVEIAVTRPEP